MLVSFGVKAGPPSLKGISHNEELMWKRIGQSSQGLSRPLMFVLRLRKITGDDRRFAAGVVRDAHVVTGGQSVDSRRGRTCFVQPMCFCKESNILLMRG